MCFYSVLNKSLFEGSIYLTRISSRVFFLQYCLRCVNIPNEVPKRFCWGHSSTKRSFFSFLFNFLLRKKLSSASCEFKVSASGEAIPRRSASPGLQIRSNNPRAPRKDRNFPSPACQTSFFSQNRITQIPHFTQSSPQPRHQHEPRPASYGIPLFC